MRRKISNAPAPITPLPPGGHTEMPEREAKPRPELPKATSPSAVMACHRFWRAARDCDQAIKMAYDPKIDRNHWASVREQWRVWRHDAERRAELCKTEGLPEPLLTEVFQKRGSLDHLWKIACDYRIKATGTKSQAVEASIIQKHSHGYKTDQIIELIKIFINDGGTLQQLEDIRPKKNLINALCVKGPKLPTEITRNTVLKALNEFKTCEYCQMTSNDK